MVINATYVLVGNGTRLGIRGPSLGGEISDCREIA